MTGLSLIIPAFNEEQGIGAVLDGLAAVRPSLPCPLEVLVVDDGSTDRTGAIAQAKGARVIRQPINLGYGASIKRGLRAAQHELVGILDADGSYDVGDLPKLVAALPAYDMVIGARQGAAYRGSLLKYPMRIVFHWLCLYVTGTRVSDVNSGFRLFKKAMALTHEKALCQSYSFTTSLTMVGLLEGYVVGFVPIRYGRRLGRSKVRLIRDTLRSSQILFEIIVLYNPVKIFLVLGLVPFALGALDAFRHPVASAVLLATGFLIWSLGGLGVSLSRRNRS